MLRAPEKYPRAIKTGQQGLSLEILHPQHLCIRDEQHTRMMGKERLEAGQDLLDALLGCDCDDHDKAVAVIEQKPPAVIAAMPQPRDIAYDRIAGDPRLLQQVLDRGEVVALDDDLDLFHRVKRKDGHGSGFLALVRRIADGQ